MVLRVVSVGLLAVCVGVTGCERRTSRNPAAQSSVHAAHDAGSAGARAEPTRVVAPPAGGASHVVHCRALEPHGTVTLSTLKIEDDTRLFARDAAVYLFSYNQSLARVRLTRISRDGSETKHIANQQGLGIPSHYHLTNDAAYYSRHGSIVRIGLGDGVITEVASGLSPAFAVHGGRIYATIRSRHGVNDKLVMVEHPGSLPQPIVDIPTAPSLEGNVHSDVRRDYDYRDVSADDNEVFISDWDAGRVIAVSLKDNAVHDIVSRRPFVLVRKVEPDAIVFSAASGLYRQLRSGGEVTRLSEVGKAPETVSFDSDESDFWLYQTEHFKDVFGVYRVPSRGGTTVRFATFPSYIPTDPLHEDGFKDLSVDDECLYYARRISSGTDKLSVLAQPKDTL